MSRHFLLVILATSAVTLLPVVAARMFEITTGIESIFISFAIGVTLSIVVSNLGARLWSSLVISDEIVFGELMLWGWVRRLRSDKRLERATRMLGLDGRGWAPESELTPEEQARVLQDLAVALERRDPYTHGHTNRVTRYAYAIAREMGLDPVDVENIRVAASVHDVGKMDIPLEILTKPGALTDAEFEAIKEHSAIGSEMVSRLGSPAITEMVRHHHERLDGRGYPDGLAGDAIPLGARIIAVADTFDAICSTRSYRKAAKHKMALGIIKKESGTQLDRAAVEAFVRYYSGRGTFEWRATVTTIPQRVLGSIGRTMPGGVVQNAAAAAAAVTIASAPMTLVPDAVRLHHDASRSITSTSAAAVETTGFGLGTTGANRTDDSSAGTDASIGGDLDERDGGSEGVSVPISDPGAEPVTDPIDPGGGSTTDPVTRPATDPIPTEDKVTEPVKQITDPVNEVTEPVDKVTDPVTDVTDPVNEVTEPVDTVTDPVDKVTEPVDKVTDPVTDITDPVTDPIDGVTKR